MQKNYEILWLKNWASLTEVKEAFRRLSLLTHPDRWWSESLFKIINWAYTEILKSLKDWSSKRTVNKTVDINFTLKPSAKKKDLNGNKIVETICREVFNTFKLLNYNPFIIWIRWKYLIIIVRRYNSLDAVQSNKLNSIPYMQVFKFKTSYDICKYLCNSHWVDTDQKWFDANVKQLLIKLTAKDIIQENGWMAFNDNWKKERFNSKETVDIKDYGSSEDKEDNIDIYDKDIWKLSVIDKVSILILIIWLLTIFIELIL